MKSRFKNLLSAFTAVGLVMPFAGCETEAEEAEQGSASTPIFTNTVAGAIGPSTGSTNTASASTESESPTEGTSTTVATSEAAATTNSTTPAAAAGADATTVAATEVAQNSGSTNDTVILNRIPPTVPPNVKLTKGVEEVIKLSQSGLSETVILLYIEKSAEPFDLDAAEIVYLNDIGISSVVLAAMLSHDGAGEEVLASALGTNNVDAASATVDTNAPALAQQSQPPPQLEISSNYVATPQPGQTVMQDPNAQGQQTVVVDQQQPTVIYQQQPTVVVTEPAVTYSYFYSSLSPYGSWVQIPDYGWCWQPTIAVTHHGWRPYVHGGRWFHSNAGWYWHSDYSWGWAPFHYGRWYCAPRAGWVWMPDHTWGPSWVTWRRTGAYTAWAPLPPYCDVRPGIGFSYFGRNVGFNFSFGYSSDYYCWVPTRRFCDRRVIDHVVPSRNARDIYRNSTVVNNYIVGDNNTIINNGIGRDYVANHTRNEIPRVRVADAASAGRPVAPDRVHRRGTEAVVYRPNRPSPNQIAVHEATMRRSRGETARPQDLASTGRGSVSPIRTERPQVAPSAGLGGARSGGLSRVETARPNTASRGNNEPARTATPVFATPAPIRPEPDRSAEILRSRSVQESRVRPGTTVGNGQSTTIPSRPGIVRPRTVPNASTVTPNNNTARPGLPRNEVGRGAATPNTITRPSPSVTRPGAVQPSTTQPSRGGVEAARPNLAPSTTTRPSISSPGIRQQSEPARSPDLARPQATRPAQAQPQTPSVRPSAPVNRPSYTPGQRGAVAPTRPSYVPGQRGTTVSPARPAPAQPQQRAPAAQPRQERPRAMAPQVEQRASLSSPVAARPNFNSRRESFARPSATVRTAPAPTIVQPRGLTPVPPQVSVSASRPSISAPSDAPRYSAPSRPAPSYSARPSRGGGSAPSVAPTARPAPSSGRSYTPGQRGTPSGGGRGRVEIGR